MSTVGSITPVGVTTNAARISMMPNRVTVVEMMSLIFIYWNFYDVMQKQEAYVSRHWVRTRRAVSLRFSCLCVVRQARAIFAQTCAGAERAGHSAIGVTVMLGSETAKYFLDVLCGREVLDFVCRSR